MTSPASTRFATASRRLPMARSSPSGRCANLLQSEHPWVRAYFHGKRSLMLQPQSELNEKWKPALPSSLSAPSCWRRSSPCSASSYWLHNTGGLGRARPIASSSKARCRGLLVGAAVLFNGIRVGEVSDLGLAPGNPRGVNATISVASTTPVRADTKVGLEFQGLTGVPVIALEGGTRVRQTPARCRRLLPNPGPAQGMSQAARDALRKVDSVLSENSGALQGHHR